MAYGDWKQWKRRAKKHEAHFIVHTRTENDTELQRCADEWADAHGWGKDVEPDPYNKVARIVAGLL